MSNGFSFRRKRTQQSLDNFPLGCWRTTIIDKCRLNAAQMWLRISTYSGPTRHYFKGITTYDALNGKILPCPIEPGHPKSFRVQPPLSPWQNIATKSHFRYVFVGFAGIVTTETVSKSGEDGAIAHVSLAKERFFMRFADSIRVN